MSSTLFVFIYFREGPPKVLFLGLGAILEVLRDVRDLTECDASNSFYI